MTAMIPSDKIFFGVPCGDHRIDVDCMLSIFRSIQNLSIANHVIKTYFHKGVSDIALARNCVVDAFLKSECEWLMMVDSDIYFSEKDWAYLWEGDEDIVTAPYARKLPGASPANFGLGFTRVHRRVFEAIDALQNDNGAESAQRYYMDGKMHVHYFPNGVTGDSRWLGEDRGFFTLCMMTGIEYRLENRCQLQHGGRFNYGFPFQDNGAKFWQPPNVANDPQCQAHGIENCQACNGDIEEDKPIVLM